jgi:alkylation response protein AidB-like acyl-CoA dehydrogenase
LTAFDAELEESPVDVRVTEEQQALQKAAREWLHQKFPAERIGAIADAPPAADPAVWREIAAMGWVGLSVPEDAGGGGASVIEEALLAEECGRGLLAAPVFGSTRALPILAAGGDHALLRAVISGDRSVALAHAEPDGPERLDQPPQQSTVDERGRLTGRKLYVLDLPVVTDVVVTVAGRAGVELWAVDLRVGGDAVDLRVGGDAVHIEVVPTIDGTRSLGHLALDGAPALLLAAGERAAAAIAESRLRTLVLLAAECVGVGQHCVDVAVEHAKQREQFGRPIASYQAVAFPLADAHAQVEWARSLTYWAAWAIAVGDPLADSAASAAKLTAAEAAVFAAERAIQTFGGIGMTWDQPVHRWYKRALAALALEGSGNVHRDRIAATLLDSSAT